MGPPAPATRLLPPLVLALAGVARGTFTVRARPGVAVVPFGGSVLLNCSRSPCPGGNASLGLETPLAATPWHGGHRWQSFLLPNVSRWDPGPVTCSGRCGDTAATASAALLVYRLPQRVALDPVPPVAVGDSHNVTCHVEEVAPVGNLTVTLRRGTETLRTESFGHAEGSASVAVGHLLTVTRGDHGQDVTCHAELSLRPHGPLFARAATPVTLSVFALPEPPHLQVPPVLEAGATSPATCRVPGAFPAGDTRVTLRLGRQPLNATLAVAGDAVTAATTLAPSAPGPRDVTCTAAVATAARTARRRLHVYRFPVPTLELSPAPAREGTEVTATCQAGATDPPAARLQLRDAHGGVLAEGPPPRLQLRLATRREDDGRALRCQASLALGGTEVTKDAAARLVVHYGPELPPGSCPSNRTWVRGALEALTCRARGNPVPTVSCARAGVPVGTAEPEPVTRAHAGTYECRATNPLGTLSRSVTVRVEYEPTLSERGCPERRVWVEGQRWHLECRAEGDPPPSTRCARLGGTRDSATHLGDTHGAATHLGDTRDGATHLGDTRGAATHLGDTRDGATHFGDTHDGGTGHEGTPEDNGDSGTGHGGTPDSATHPGGPTRARGSRRVSRADAGHYVCQATNRHGVATRNVVVTVEYGPSIGERGCPGRRLWLEGTPARLGCAASGNPPPLVTCAKVGDPRDHPPGTLQEGRDRRDRPLVASKGTWHKEGGTQGPPVGAPTVPRGTQGPPEGAPTAPRGTQGPPEGAPTMPRGTQGPPEGAPTMPRGTQGPPEGAPTMPRGTQGPPEGAPTAPRGTQGPSSVPPNVTWATLGATRDPPMVPPKSQRDPQDPSPVPPTVTRAHAGTYRCQASNAHGSASRDVTVAVEYGPAAVTLRVVPSANVTRGATFSLACGAEGVPAPTFAWAVPPAPNLRVATDNRSVTVTGATPANRGHYTCTASNRHGHSAGTVLVRVDEGWLVALVALGSLGAVTALALAVAGGYYLKTTACKKGEYNVRDAEGTEGACRHRDWHRDWHRDSRAEIFGIQLTQP